MTTSKKINTQKGIAPIVILVIAVLAIGGGATYIATRDSEPAVNEEGMTEESDTEEVNETVEEEAEGTEEVVEESVETNSNANASADTFSQTFTLRGIDIPNIPVVATIDKDQPIYIDEEVTGNANYVEVKVRGELTEDTTVTFSGLVPNQSYVLYEDALDSYSTIKADADGVFVYILTTDIRNGIVIGKTPIQLDQSLTDAQNAAKDAAAKANMSQTRAEAEIYYERNDNGYQYVCSYEYMLALFDVAQNSTGTVVKCSDTENSWGASLVLNSGESFCVDSTGYKGLGKITGNSTSCK